MVYDPLGKNLLFPSLLIRDGKEKLFGVGWYMIY